MTPKERVLTTLDHREPDCVPVDLGATMCSSLTLKASENLKAYLGLPEGSDEITNPLTESVALSEEVLRLFRVEFRTVRMKGPENANAGRGAAGDAEITDEFGTVWKRTGYDYVPSVFSYADAELADLKSLPKPDFHDPGRVKGLRDEASALHQENEFAVVGDFICGGPFEQAQRIRGFEQFLVDMYSDPKFAGALLDMLTDNAIGLWDAMLSEAGEYVDIVCQGDDLGIQTGLMISPEMYRKFVKSRHKRLFDFIRSKTGARIWLHSCGSVFDIIPDLIEAGVEILNPVQVSAANMDLSTLKKTFRGEISFWGGGIDIQKLPFQTADEIKDTVTRAIETMAPGGGYVFAASHNILPDTKGENIYLAYKTADSLKDCR